MKIINDISNIIVYGQTPLKEALLKLDDSGLQILLVADKDGKLIGVITDGDIRRYILNGGLFDEVALKIANKNFLSIDLKEIAYINNMFNQNKNINQLPIVDENGCCQSMAIRSENYLRLFEKKATPVVIMAGGKGTRLSPLTKIIPKPLIPVGGVTMLEKIIEKFHFQNFHDFRVIVNYKKELISSYLSEIDVPYDIKIINENKYRGTIGGLSDLKGSLDGDFILSNCDILTTLNYQALLDWHNNHNAALTILGVRKNMDVPYGVITINNELSVKKIQEKPSFNYLIVSGVYVLNSSVLDYISENEVLGMDELIARLINKGIEVSCYPIEDGWHDMGQFEEYRNLIKNLGGDVD